MLVFPPQVKYLAVLCILLVITPSGSAWTNGELLIWMDSDRAPAMVKLAQRFKEELGVQVRVDTPEKITNNFPLAAESLKGPDIVIWAHDKIGEWADGGLIAPIAVSKDFQQRFFPKSWEAVEHHSQLWGYPICFEVVGLIYNKKLISGKPPSQLDQFIEFNKVFKREHPDKTSILWDYSSPYYTWGIMASGGAYIYKRVGSNFDLGDVGVASPPAVQGLTQVSELVKQGVLPRMMATSSVPQEMMAGGKLAMMISGPWDWANLMKNGIDFGVVPIPGIDGKVGRAFVGVSVAYLNGSSPNGDLAKEFIEHYLLTDQALTEANHLKPIGIPALTSVYDSLAKDNPLLSAMKTCADHGEVMPNIPQMGRFWTALGSALQIATTGRASAKIALDDARDSMLKR